MTTVVSHRLTFFPFFNLLSDMGINKEDGKVATPLCFRKRLRARWIVKVVFGLSSLTQFRHDSVELPDIFQTLLDLYFWHSFHVSSSLWVSIIADVANIRMVYSFVATILY